MEEDSTPAPSDNDAGGKPADDKPADDHSQDQPSNAADKQGDKTPPSTPTDKPAEGDKPEDGGKPAEGDKPAEGEEGKDAPASKFDEDLDEWAEKRGYEKPDNDKERKLLQDIRNGQRDFSRDKQAKKAAETLSKATKDATPKSTPGEDDDGDPLEKDVKSLKDELKEERVMRNQSEYFSTNNVTEEEATAMGDFLKEKVERAAAKSPEAAKAALDYWTDPDNLEDWHKMAQARMPAGDDKNTQEIEEEAARKERERIQKEHQASGSSRSASRTTTSDKTEDEKRLERFSNWD